MLPQDIERFREFVVFESNLVYPEYLIAYQRVEREPKPESAPESEPEPEPDFFVYGTRPVEPEPEPSPDP